MLEERAHAPVATTTPRRVATALLTQFRDADAERDKDEIDRAYVGGKVPLGVPRVLMILDSLAAVIRTTDAPVWALCWSRTGREGWPEAVTKLYQQKYIVIEPA